MRRLLQHALIGVAVSVVAGGVVVGTLMNASADQPRGLTAVPPVISSSAPPASTPTPRPQLAESDRRESDSRSADRAAVNDEQAALVAKAKKAAAKRAKALAKKQTKITNEDEAIKKANAESEAERKKQEAERKELGYDADTTDPREIARQMMDTQYSWGDDEFTCYDLLIKSESQWDVNATNPSSGAYGIPQSLPGNKMASAGSDWQTNPATQIKWGLSYVKTRYSTPCNAWSFKQGNNWY